MSLSEILHKPALFKSLPLWLPILTGLLVLVGDLLRKREKRSSLLFLAGLALLMLALGFSIRALGCAPGYFFQGALYLDGLSYFICALILMILIYTLVISHDWLGRQTMLQGEFYLLLMSSATGMMLMGSSANFITFFLGLELMSIPLYILCASLSGNRAAIESAFKYFILGAFSSALLVFGIAFIYGASGTLDWNALMQGLYGGQPFIQKNLFYIGLGLLLVGLCFKIASVPFHMWAPDVYQGAPANVTAFMASGVKVAAFAVFFRLINVAFLPAAGTWSGVLMIICLVTMTWGNLAAIAQTNVKRMLAYSSIAHAGYMLIAIVINKGLATQELGVALFFYLFSYSLMTLGAFGIVLYLERGKPAGATFDDFSGLAFQRPAIAFCMAVFMFSLAGFPPSAGFFAKFFLFKAAVHNGAVGLVLFAILNSLISVYYYLRVVYFMYMKPAVGAEPAPPSLLQTAPALALVGAILGLGLFPGGWIEFLRLIFSAFN